MKNMFFMISILAGCFISISAGAQDTTSSVQCTSRVVEDGGTGPYKALTFCQR